MKWSLLLEIKSALGQDFGLSPEAAALIEKFGIQARGQTKRSENYFSKTSESGTKKLEIGGNDIPGLIWLYDDADREYADHSLYFLASDDRGVVETSNSGVYLYSEGVIRYYDAEAYSYYKEATHGSSPMIQMFESIGLIPDGIRKVDKSKALEELLKIMNGMELEFSSGDEEENLGSSTIK